MNHIRRNWTISWSLHLKLEWQIASNSQLAAYWRAASYEFNDRPSWFFEITFSPQNRVFIAAITRNYFQFVL